jgi:hypothetical protein
LHADDFTALDIDPLILDGRSTRAIDDPNMVQYQGGGVFLDVGFEGSRDLTKRARG